VATSVSQLASDFFGYVALFQAAPESSRLDPDALRLHLLDLLSRFENDARARGIDEREIELASFALVAWADEMILAEKWNGADFWRARPLALDRFRTVRAGNEFYERVARAAEGDDYALEIYFFCLAMGFHGELALDPERRNALIRRIWDRLYSKRRVLAVTDGGELSEPAYTWQFSDQQTEGRRVTPFLGWMVAGVGLFYFLCWGILRFVARDMLPLPGIFS